MSELTLESLAHRLAELESTGMNEKEAKHSAKDWHGRRYVYGREFSRCLDDYFSSDNSFFFLLVTGACCLPDDVRQEASKGRQTQTFSIASSPGIIALAAVLFGGAMSLHGQVRDLPARWSPALPTRTLPFHRDSSTTRSR